MREEIPDFFYSNQGEETAMWERQQAISLLSSEEFTCLVKQYQHQLHVFLAGILGSSEGAFDLVQDTFYEAWKASQRGNPPFLSGADNNEVRRWIFRVGYNDAISFLRRKRLIRWESLDCIEEIPSISHDSFPFEQQLAEGDALQTALAQMSQQDVACLLLRIVHGFSAMEAGIILRTSPENINNRLARAKRRLCSVYFQQNNVQEGA
jgi:RNA polymerase sigma-70 factor (ECF subfamily)